MKTEIKVKGNKAETHGKSSVIDDDVTLFGFNSSFEVIAVFGHVLGHKVDPIRNVTASLFGFWAIKLTQ